MRRSNSLSHIPLPNSKRDSRTKERAKSVVRCSRGKSIDAATPLLLHNRLLPPGGTKFSAQKNLLWTPRDAKGSITPTFSGGYKRSNSLSSFGSRVSIGKSPAAERKFFQKQLSDKKWLAEQHTRIKHYILTSGLFDANLAGSLRPPTIAIFVELITKLLKQVMIKTGPINTTNYGDIVITNLKLLKYPGQITNSVVKTINTMHAWPHFIAIISFLLDKASLNAMEMEFNTQLDADNQKEYVLWDPVCQFLSTICQTLAEGELEMTEPNEEQLKSDICTLIGADFEGVRIQGELVASEQLELDSVLAKLDEKKQHLDELKGQYLEKQQIIDQYEANKGNKEKEIKEEIRALKEKVIYEKEQINKLELSIKNLKNVISKQTCTVEEKVEILNQIEELKRLMERRRINAAKLRQQQDEVDEKLRHLVIEMELKADQWNVAIKQTLLPELKDLKLREKGFHKPGFLEEILEIVKIKINLEKKNVNEYDENELIIEKFQKLKESISNKNQTLSSTRKEVADLRQTLKNLEEKKQTLISDSNLFKIEHESKVKKSLEIRNQEIRENELIVQDITNELQKEIEKVKETNRSGEAAIIQAHNTTMNLFQEIHDIKHRMLEEAHEAHQMTTQQVQELFGDLVTMHENTAKLYASLEDKEN